MTGLAQTDGSGRDLTVALFTSQPAARVVVAPAGPDAWTARCATCPHQPLAASRTLQAPTELFAGGTLRITDPSTGVERRATGLWHLRAARGQAAMDIVVKLPSEHYVAAVLNAEAAPDEPPASLQALAIVARTYALNGRHYAAAPGHLPAELCDNTACQAARFGPSSAAVQRAVRDTAGETLWFHHQRAQVFFSQHCGGVTDGPAAIAPQLQGISYLPTRPDPFCLRQGPATWHADVSVDDLYRLSATQGWTMPRPLTSAAVIHRSSSGRAMALRFTGAQGTSLELPAMAFRLAVGRSMGWNRLRSDLYQISFRDQTLAFNGRGHGHGVGLCQAGAHEMAREGRSARDILAFYLPGTAVRIGPDDQGWLLTRLGDIQTAADHALSGAEQTAIRNAWLQAGTLFPTHQPRSARLVFAPSSELFRQLTHQPGWALASTSGNETVLQPAAVLAGHALPLQSLLLHEFLHQRVEAEATDRAPLWLREGLVETLAGSRLAPFRILSPEEIDRGLAAAGSRAQAEAAHRAAAALAHAVALRYGFSTVRGWLSSGVPRGITG